MTMLPAPLASAALSEPGPSLLPFVTSAGGAAIVRTGTKNISDNAAGKILFIIVSSYLKSTMFEKQYRSEVTK
jgi:hypothetical protein